MPVAVGNKRTGKNVVVHSVENVLHKHIKLPSAALGDVVLSSLVQNNFLEVGVLGFQRQFLDPAPN